MGATMDGYLCDPTCTHIIPFPPSSSMSSIHWSRNITVDLISEEDMKVDSLTVRDVEVTYRRILFSRSYA
jgi:hypothetical protein